MKSLSKLKLLSTFNSYDYRKLISTRIIDDFKKAKQHIVCDIDKTYLETKSENALQVLKIAFEDAKDKITVNGASQFLLALRWSNPWGVVEHTDFQPRSLHFVSASPPQIRSILEEKLIEDGLDWTSDSFKNQVYNIRKVKIGLLRHHVAYKTATIFSLMQYAEPHGEFYLIGDSAEFDAFIYLFLALYLEHKISIDVYCEILRLIGVQSEVADDLKERMKIKPRVKVAGILIRRVPNLACIMHSQLTAPIALFEDYYEASLIALKWGLIDIKAFKRLTFLFHNEQGFSRSRLLAHLHIASHRIFEKTSNNYQVITELISELCSLGEVSPYESSLANFQDTNIAKLHYTEAELLGFARQWAKELTAK